MCRRGVSVSLSVGLLLLVLASCSRPIHSLPIDGTKENSVRLPMCGISTGNEESDGTNWGPCTNPDGSVRDADTASNSDSLPNDGTKENGVRLPPCGNSTGNEEYDGANGGPCTNPDGSVRDADTALNSADSEVPRTDGQSPGQGFSSTPGPSSSASSAPSGGPSPAAGVPLGTPTPSPTINQNPPAPAVLQGDSPPQGQSGGDGSSGSSGGDNVTPDPTAKQGHDSQLDGSKDSSGIKGYPGDPGQP